MTKAGSRWRCAVCGAQVVVTRVTETALACCDHPMEPGTAGGPAGPAVAGGLQLGKRYRCPACEGEVLVTRAGAGPLRCHDPMVLQAPKPLATSD
ncbi:MAG: hypothetical protein K6V97_08170 [Actinomycetia bacterium]|nr:hypothetical protein [Actinomycetes bacterium]